MKQTGLILSLSLILYAEAHSASPKPTSGQASIQFDFYRIRGDISGSTSLTDNVWRELTGANPQGRDFPFSVFTLANQTLAGVKFELDKKGWRWDGKKEPPKGYRVEKIGTPRIMSILGQPFEVSLTTQPIQYFQKRKDGLFELKTLKELPGLSLSGTVSKMLDGGRDERVTVKDLTFSVRYVEKRKRLDGVSLDVGEPIMFAREVQTVLCLQTARDYGIWVRIRDGRGSLLCRIRIDLVK